MAYVRKTRDVYVLQGNYGTGWDDLLEEDTKKKCLEQLRVYNANENAPHRIIKRRVKI